MTRACWQALLACLILTEAAGAETTTVRVGNGSIVVALPSGELNVTRQALLNWVETSARTVELYYAGFPVARLELDLAPARGRVMRGTTWGGSVPLIRIAIGRAVTEADLNDDWRLVHELVHTSIPELDDDQDWLHEGLATYVEPIARAQYGTTSEDEVWKRFLEGMPLGLAAIERGGLDGNTSWAATYWGGALFCLLGDIAIRERTDNRRGLQDALAELRSAGANLTQDSEVARLLEAADEAGRGTELQDLYASLTARRHDIELSALWRDLGIALVDGRIAFDDRAPQAAIRQAITRKR